MRPITRQAGLSPTSFNARCSGFIEQCHSRSRVRRARGEVASGKRRHPLYRWTGSHDALANGCDRDTGVVIRSVLAAGLLTRVRPALDTAVLDEPIRAELFSVERLEQHAESLAAAQEVGRNPRVGLSLARRVRDNGHVLLACYRLLAEASREEGSITPAAEWLVDNYYIVDEQLRDIRDHLPRGFYRELPKLAEGHLAGYPRVLGLAWAFVAHTDSRFDPEVLRRFVLAYQRVEPLQIGELWAVAITLRIVLVENLRRLAEHIVTARRERQRADRLADGLLGLGGLGADEANAML